MKTMLFILAILIPLSLVGKNAQAQGSYMMLAGPMPPIEKEMSKRDSDVSVWTPQSRRLVKTGASMLGSMWGTCVIIGFFSAGSDLTVLQMAIPFYATSGYALEVLDYSPLSGAILMIPTIVQTIGTILIISGFIKRRRANKLIVGVGPVFFPKNGAGMGISVSL